MSPAYEPVRKLSPTDSVQAFDCGQPSLNQFLQRYALINQQAHSAQSYVCCLSGEVVGFYSLTVGSVDPADAPARVMKGLARYPVLTQRDVRLPRIPNKAVAVIGMRRSGKTGLLWQELARRHADDCG